MLRRVFTSLCKPIYYKVSNLHSISSNFGLMCLFQRKRLDFMFCFDLFLKSGLSNSLPAVWVGKTSAVTLPFIQIFPCLVFPHGLCFWYAVFLCLVLFRCACRQWCQGFLSLHSPIFDIKDLSLSLSLSPSPFTIIKNPSTSEKDT